MTGRSLALVTLLLTATPAAAQPLPIADSYTLRLYAVGASAPAVAPYTFPATAAVCRQLAPAPPDVSTMNPTTVEWDDVGQIGAVCHWVDSGTGPLVAVPIGAYDATLAANTGTVSSGESVRAPFSREPPVGLILPPVPTGLRLFRLVRH